MAIFTAIATAILGAGSAWIGITAAALEIGTGIALNLAAKAISGSSSTAATQQGVSGTLQAGGDVERSFIFGLGSTAGSLVYANEWGSAGGTPNAYHTQVICVSDIPVAGGNGTGLVQLFVNGTLATINWGATPTTQGYPVTEYNKNGADHLWVKFYDGTQTTADSFLTGTVASTDRPYSSARVGTGCAYVIVTALVESTLFNGLPSYKFGIQGAKLYDITKDTTAGGSGSHRWSDPTTWGGDGDNFPAVQVYNLLRGMTYGGLWLYGLQNMPAARLPNAAWIASIGKCRTTITGVSGAEPTYRSGGEVGVNAPIADTVTSLLTTCQGRLIETGGVYKMSLGAPDSPSFSFSDDLILSSEDQSFTPFFGLADTINGITATYPDPAAGWNATVAPPLYNSTYEALDGNRRLLANVKMDFVPYPAQAQRLMKSALLEGRRARRHTFTLPPDGWVLEPGDIVSYTSVRNGYSAKSFRVDGIADRANLDVIIDITEVDPTDYNWTHATDYTAPAVAVLVVSRPSPQPIVGLSVSGATVYDSSGNARKPTIQLNWDGTQPDVSGVLWQVRLQSSGAVLASGQISDATAGTGILPAGPYLPNTAYEVRAQYTSWHLTRDFTWSSWLAVTTPNIPIDVIDFGPRISALVDFYNRAIADLQEGAAKVASILDSQDFANYQDKQTLQLKVTSQVGSAIAISGALFQAATSAIAAEATARIAAFAQLGTAFAAGLIEFDSTVAGSGGSSVATITIKVKAQVGDTAADSGFVIVASADGAGGTTSQILAKANQFFITDGVHISDAFTFDATTGTLVLKNVLFQSLKDISTNHVSINGNTGAMTLSS